MHKSYKYRIYPTPEQEVLLNKTFGCVRVVWNRYVETFNSYDKETNPKPEYQTSTQIRSEFEWMKEVCAGALSQKENDFKEFKKQYFSKTRKSKIGRPSFKKKSDKQAYRLQNQKYKLGNHQIKLEKIGWISAVINRRPSNNCKFCSITISKDKVGKYFASVLVEENHIPSPKTNQAVGVDLGLKELAITSDGVKYENPRWFRESQAKLRKAQKNLSRKVKGSSRWEKSRLRVARLYSKTTNQRKWFHHQISSDLVKNYDFIGLEDLNVAGMKKNRKLAKSISDAGWGQLVSFIEYKAKWNDKEVIKINRFFPSSKTCFECGSINKELKLSDREWTCESCGCILDRDINAASNILSEALNIKQTAQGVACA